MNTKQKFQAAAMIAGVAVFHYFIPRDALWLHILFRLLYLVPISFIALYTGRLGGVATALAVSLIFLPHFFIETPSREFLAGNIGAVALFFLTGFFVGNFRDLSEREIIVHKKSPKVVPTHDDTGYTFFFYVDDTPLSKATAAWLSSFFHSSDISVTLLCFYNKDESETSSSLESARERVSSNEQSTLSLLDNVSSELIHHGLVPEKISLKPVAVTGKKLMSDLIVQELQGGGYDMVILPKHEKNKAQEFLFGDTAIQLLRKAPVPVLSVKGQSEASGAMETLQQ